MLASPTLRVEAASLPVGDMLWVAESKADRRRYVLDGIVERKLVPDLIESIKDGRYQEQRDRLRLSGLRRITYLIEGPLKGETTAGAGAGNAAAAAGAGAGRPQWAPGGGAAARAFWAKRAKAADGVRAPGAAAAAATAAVTGGGGGGGGHIVDTAALETVVATLETCFGYNVFHSLGFEDTRAFLQRTHADLVAWYSMPAVARRVRLQVLSEERVYADRARTAAAGASFSSLPAAENAWTPVRGEGELLEHFSTRMQKSGGASHATMFLAMLRQVKGVGAAQAAAVVREYGTPATLAAAFERCATAREADAMLSGVCGVPKAAAARVREVWMDAVYASSVDETAALTASAIRLPPQALLDAAVPGGDGHGGALDAFDDFEV
jgi:ERCC4-type nuclease